MAKTEAEDKDLNPQFHPNADDDKNIFATGKTVKANDDNVAGSDSDGFGTNGQNMTA